MSEKIAFASDKRHRMVFRSIFDLSCKGGAQWCCTSILVPTKSPVAQIILLCNVPTYGFITTQLFWPSFAIMSGPIKCSAYHHQDSILYCRLQRFSFATPLEAYGGTMPSHCTFCIKWHCSFVSSLFSLHQ